MPLTPDDPHPDLDQRLAALHALGAVELDQDEKERIAAKLDEIDQISKEQMSGITSHGE